MATPRFSSRFSAGTESVYAKMTKLSLQHNAVNLGQGFPEDEPDDELLSVASKALVDGSSQYVSPRGIEALRLAISSATERRYKTHVDPSSEVLVTTGAEAALSAAFLTLVEPGDEVVIFAPYYMHFRDKAAMVGASLKVVPLESQGAANMEALREACSGKTKLIIANSPSNPLGHVFTRAELEDIGQVARDVDAFVVFDDAYEYFVFDGREHVCGLSVEGIRDRAICVSSLGKTFFATGWRVGYVMAPPKVIDVMAIAHLQMNYCVPGHLQVACAQGLGRPDSFFQQRCDDFQARRDLLCDGLKKLGIENQRPEGGFFLGVPVGAFGAADDVALAKELVEKAKVATVPLSPCFPEPASNQHQIRFCFAKKPETLQAGIDNLARWKA